MREDIWGGAPQGGAPQGGAPQGGARSGEPKMLRLFLPPATNLILSYLSWGLKRRIKIKILGGGSWERGHLGGPEGWAPQGVGPRRGRPRRVGAQNFVLFFRLPPQFSFILPSLGCLLVEFWWFLKRRGPEMFGVLGLHLWPFSLLSPALGPLGLHTTTPEPKRAHFRAPGASKTPPKFHEKTPKRGKKE